MELAKLTSRELQQVAKFKAQWQLEYETFRAQDSAEANNDIWRAHLVFEAEEDAPRVKRASIKRAQREEQAETGVFEVAEDETFMMDTAVRKGYETGRTTTMLRMVRNG